MSQILNLFSSLISLLLGDIWKGLLMPILNMFSSNSTPKEHMGQEKVSSPLTARQIELIRQSWALVADDKQNVGIKMFTRLFEIAPYLRDLFPFGYDLECTALRTHALGVMQTVEVAVEGLDNLETLAPKLVELGRVHKPFEITGKEFGHVGAALLWTFETGLGDQFTAEAKQAWVDAYGVIQGAMEEGLK